ncbi:helix-turn-helix transcriptional regulator [Lachnospiraceae bacterium 46-61]
MLIAYKTGDKMKQKGLGKRINEVRKDRKLTAEKLSELCNINATYLRQIEGGKKMPSLPVFITICNMLKISPNYLLQDTLTDNEISKIKELQSLWENTSPCQQEIAITMIEAVLEHQFL